MTDWKQWLRDELEKSIRQEWFDNGDYVMQDGRLYEDVDGELEEVEVDMCYGDQLNYHLLPLAANKLEAMQAEIDRLEQELYEERLRTRD